MSDIVVVDSGQTYESTESAIVAKNEADRAEQWAKYSEEKANLSEQSALEAAQSKENAKAQADRAQNISDAFNANAAAKTNTFNSNYEAKTASFNSNAADKTTAFNNNAASKQALVDASASAAAASAQEAANSAVAARPLSAKNITNCITAIPQDIKLELVDGVMTLKAGSKVYVPNGSETFEEVTIESDLSAGSGEGWSTDPYLFAYNYTQKKINQALLYKSVSGDSPEATSNSFVYNTSTNKINRCESDSSLSTDLYSFPFAIVLNPTGNRYETIDKIFNGFGYIGSTAFILPGVKGLAPYGRNEDGSLKNFEIQFTGVYTRSITWDCSKGQELFLGYYSGAMNPGFVSTGGLWRYFEKSTEPSSPKKYDIWYNPDANIIKRYLEDGWKDVRLAYLGQWFTESISPYRVTELKTKPTFHAVDYNDYAEDIQKCKLIAYDRGYNPGSVSGNFTAVLQDWHERFSIPVTDNVTITIDTSQLTFPEEWYTIVIEIYFINGAKTVNLSYAGGIRWVNGLTPDFTNGASHLVALTKHRSWSDVAMSDAGSFGG